MGTESDGEEADNWAMFFLSLHLQCLKRLPGSHRRKSTRYKEKQNDHQNARTEIRTEHYCTRETRITYSTQGTQERIHKKA